MLKFEFRKEKLVLTPEILLFDEFREIIRADRSKGKYKSDRIFLYIYYLCDLSEENDVRNSPNKTKDAYFKAFSGRNVVNLTDADKDRIEAAVKRYITVNETAEERMLGTFDMKSEELRRNLDDVIPETETNESDGVTYFVTNSKIVSSALTELSDIKKKRDIIVSAVRRESLSSRVFGQKTLSPLSKGDITLYRDSDANNYRTSLIKSDDEAAIIQRESLNAVDRLKADRAKKLREAQ